MTHLDRVERLSLFGHFSLYLLNTSGGPVLIDTGPPLLYPLLCRRLASFGLLPADLTGVVLTHFHLDHVGSASRLADLGVPIWALEADAAILRGTTPHPGYGANGFGVLESLEQLVLGTPRLSGVRSLEAGARLFDSEWKIVAAPGHTPGSLALFDESAGDLISGDTLVAVFGIATGPHALFTANLEQSQRSAELLLDLEPARILSGHGPILPASSWAHLRRTANR